MRRMLPFVLLALVAVACGKRPDVADATVPHIEPWCPYQDLPFGSAQPCIASAAFDKVRSGMTLGELTDLLGRGWVCVQYSGTGTIRWKCEDGRELSVLPISYRQAEIIRVDGGTGGIGRMWMTAECGTRAVDVPAK